MSVADEIARKLPAVLHVLMTLLTVPYLLLAFFFVMVGRVASQKGIWDILDAFLNTLNWGVTWGILLLGITVLTISTLGCFESLRWWASLALAILTAATLGILVFYRPTFPELGEFVFFLPAILILIASVWRLFR